MVVLIKSQIPRIQYTYETELGLNKNHSKADSLRYVSDVLIITQPTNALIVCHLF